MKLKKREQTSLWRVLTVYKRRKSNLFISLIIVVIITIWSFSMIYYGALLQRDSSMGGIRQSIHYALKSNINIPFNYIKTLFSTPNTKQLSIDIKHKDYQKLAYNRSIAYQQGTISESEYFPAKLTHNNIEYKIGIRLAGRALDHVNNDKWSLRIKMKNKKTLLGMRKFNLLHPKVRNGLYEWFCHQISNFEGLISLKTDFVSVSINGKDKGVYFLEESFDKYLVERNKHREGIIFKPLVPELHIYQKEKMLSDSSLKEQLSLLDKLFDSFINGQLPAHKIFDVKKTAKYFAITDLVNGFHQVAPENMHLYFNPITGKIEPIGREWGVRPYIDITTISGELENAQFIGTRGIINSKIFSDEVFFKVYIRELNRISKKEYLDNFLKYIEKNINQNMNLIYRNYPYYYFDREYLYNNQKFIRSKLNPMNPLKIYYEEQKNGKMKFYGRNQINLPIQINSVRINSKEYNTNTLLLGPIKKLEQNQFVPIPIDIIDEINNDDIISGIKVYWDIYGLDIKNEIELIPWPFSVNIVQNSDMHRMEPNYKSFDFLETNENSKIIDIIPGKWIVNKTIVFPAGYTIKCYGDVELNLVNNSSIISYSPLYFSGTKTNPILVHSVDNTGQGIITIDANERSVLNNVEFIGLSNPESFGWSVTGAITFYQSDVNIMNCQFKRNRSEDYLNIVRSNVVIDSSKFIEVFSDAFDGDFVNGEVTNCLFQLSGNDGVDVSGSEIKLDKIVFLNIGDKAVSIGEDSKCLASNLDIQFANVGIASKDKSVLLADNINIYNSEAGIVVYQKKSEFGPASVEVRELEMKEVNKPYLIENNSQLSINGESLKADQNNVFELLYPKN